MNIEHASCIIELYYNPIRYIYSCIILYCYFFCVSIKNGYYNNNEL